MESEGLLFGNKLQLLCGPVNHVDLPLRLINSLTFTYFINYNMTVYAIYTMLIKYVTWKLNYKKKYSFFLWDNQTC